VISIRRLIHRIRLIPINVKVIFNFIIKKAKKKPRSKNFFQRFIVRVAFWPIVRFYFIVLFYAHLSFLCFDCFVVFCMRMLIQFFSSIITSLFYFLLLKQCSSDEKISDVPLIFVKTIV